MNVKIIAKRPRREDKGTKWDRKRLNQDRKGLNKDRKGTEEDSEEGLKRTEKGLKRTEMNLKRDCQLIWIRNSAFTKRLLRFITIQL